MSLRPQVHLYLETTPFHGQCEGAAVSAELANMDHPRSSALHGIREEHTSGNAAFSPGR